MRFPAPPTGLPHLIGKPEVDGAADDSGDMGRGAFPEARQSPVC